MRNNRLDKQVIHRDIYIDTAPGEQPHYQWTFLCYENIALKNYFVAGSSRTTSWLHVVIPSS